MKKQFLLLIFLFGSVNMALCQVDTTGSTPEVFNWDSIPVMQKLTPAQKKEKAVILKDHRVIEYIYNSDDNLISYYTIHKIVHVNNDDAVQEYNKVYIPMDNVIKIVTLKARAISKDGKVTLFNKDNIKELKNVENAGEFKEFAIDGLSVGSEVEFLYTLKKFPDFFGSEYFQSDEPEKNVEMDIISPQNLTFEAKSYNGFAKFQPDSTLPQKNEIKAKMDSIPALKKEEYSSYTADLMRVEYKLSYNTTKGAQRLLTWNDAAQRYYEIIFKTDKKDQNKARSFLNKIKIKGLSEPDQIRKIESYVKNNVVLSQQSGPDYINISKIVKNKYANSTGMTRLFMALFKAANIKTELVLTSDRTVRKFDGSFDSWNYLQHYVIYFPKENNYLAPAQPFNRYGYIPYEWTDNDGLFIKPVTIGTFTTGMGQVKHIPATSDTLSTDNIYADIHFDKDNPSKVNMHLKRSMSGYSAVGIQPVYSALPPDKQKEATESLLKVFGDDVTLSNEKTENYDENDILVKPFIVECDLKTNALVDRAGDKLLFKIGQVIGEQVQMYDNKDRKTEVVNDFNRVYYRVITFHIPDGYKATNLNALNSDVFYKKDGKRMMQFKSSYTQKGNTVTVTINEFYKMVTCPLKIFESFRKVINASADFNKVVLVFEKK